MTLQDLFDKPPRVSQEMLVACLELQQQVESLKMDLDSTLGEIGEMLLLGSPIEQGALTCVLKDGRLAVLDTTDDGANGAADPLAGEEIPF